MKLQKTLKLLASIDARINILKSYYPIVSKLTARTLDKLLNHVNRNTELSIIKNNKGNNNRNNHIQ